MKPNQAPTVQPAKYIRIPNTSLTTVRKQPLRSLLLMENPQIRTFDTLTGHRPTDIKILIYQKIAIPFITHINKNNIHYQTIIEQYENLNKMIELENKIP